MGSTIASHFFNEFSGEFLDLAFDTKC